MNRQTCQAMEELLVDFADEALTGAEAARVRAHIEQCPHCRATLTALRQSLAAARTIWQDNVGDVSRSRVPRSHKWRYAAAAAGILLAIGVLVHQTARHQPTAGAPTMTEIEKRIAESGHAAGLLARIGQLETQTSQQDVARGQYRYLAEKYPDTTAAESARRKLKSLR